jgi:hypothetical protein
LLEALMVACGKHVSSSYLQMLETEISEVLYHLEIFEKMQGKIKPASTPNGKLAAWGMGDDDFNE